MNEQYGEWYDEFKAMTQTLDDGELFGEFDELIHSAKNTFAFNRKLMEKAIDVSWVEAIENGMIHVDNCLRNPRKTIEDVEEVVPIALSKKITVESVKHLAQHTDFIQSVDKKTGKITPSKILNVYKEESWMTYENRFINTLIDRLYIFINRRYEKLAQVSQDEQVYTLGYDGDIDDGMGGKMRVEVKLETVESLDKRDMNGLTIWQRVEKIKKAIEGYKGSELCMKLGTAYIRPPVMRTNAIMKNVDLKACLTLWQYIESYDKVGYEINMENTAVKPKKDYVEDFYKIVIMNLLLFRAYTASKNADMTELKTKKFKPTSPKYIKKFDNELSSAYNIVADTAAGYISTDGDYKFTKKTPKNISAVFDQINAVIEIEKEFLRQREAERLEKLKAEEEAERIRKEEEARLAELRRIEEARRAELERIEREEAEKQRQLEEMLAKKRAEQEALERERERQEQERLARIEERRKKREEEERAAAEREQLEANKQMARAELGNAEGIDTDSLPAEEEQTEPDKKVYDSLTEEDIKQAQAVLDEAAAAAADGDTEAVENAPEFEDPREVAARMKLEQQKREKERIERERAERLKAERQYFESKPFRTIYKAYSKNPIYLIPRLIKWVLAYVFGLIPEDTDDPDLKIKLAEMKKKKEALAREKEERDKMEVYYRKYAQTTKYRVMRDIADIKFKRKKRKDAKGKPKPVYVPPKRTAEEQAAINKEMKRLYKEYHVTIFEKIRRAVEDFRIRRKNNEV